MVLHDKQCNKRVPQSNSTTRAFEISIACQMVTSWSGVSDWLTADQLTSLGRSL